MKHAYLIVVLLLGIAVLYFANVYTPKPFNLYFYNEVKDRELNNGNVGCDSRAVMAVTRKAQIEKTPETAVRTLIETGPSAEDRIAGFSSEFPHTGFKLLEAKTTGDTLTLTFTEVPSFTSGGSCRTGLLRTQIEKTALQFAEIKYVVLLPEDIFQP